MVLHLTTPLMGSKDKQVANKVLGLQKLLVQHGYLNDVPDGQYGPLTAQAVEAGKEVMGYLHPDKVAGDLFVAYLSGRRDTTPTMMLLAKKRAIQKARKAAQTPTRVKALNILIAKNGMKEHPPNTNRCEISEWYGLIGAWCAMTGIYAYDHAGSKVFTRANAHKHNWAYVPNIESDAIAGRNGLSITNSPVPGNGICYHWPGEPNEANHYGTFEKWIEVGKTFYAREGNTGIGNDSNGGELMQRERSVEFVRRFVSING